MYLYVKRFYVKYLVAKILLCEVILCQMFYVKCILKSDFMLIINNPPKEIPRPLLYLYLFKKREWARAKASNHGNGVFSAEAAAGGAITGTPGNS